MACVGARRGSNPHDRDAQHIAYAHKGNCYAYHQRRRRGREGGCGETRIDRSRSFPGASAAPCFDAPPGLCAFAIRTRRHSSKAFQAGTARSAGRASFFAGYWRGNRRLAAPSAPRFERIDDALEGFAALLKILKHTPARAGRREKHRVPRLRQPAAERERLLEGVRAVA